MKHFDCHIHIHDEAAEFVPAAMQAQDATRYAILSLSQSRFDPAQNVSVLYSKALDPERCFAFFGLDHPKAGESTPDYLAQVKTWLAAGYDGLKLIETKPTTAKDTGVRLDDEVFEPMFAYCEEQQVPILWHNGDPANFWDPETCPQDALDHGWDYTDGSFLPLGELYGIVERVMDRHPKLRVTFAHFYFTSDDPAHAKRMMEKYPNVRFDVTPGTEMYGGFTVNAEELRPFFFKYADRIQFGSDSFVNAPVCEYGQLITSLVERFFTTEDEFVINGFNVKGYDLPQENLDKLYGGVAETFVGAKPKAICPEGAKKACDQALALLESRNDPRTELCREQSAKIASLVK